jgi:hypothetical protein
MVTWKERIKQDGTVEIEKIDSVTAEGCEQILRVITKDYSGIEYLLSIRNYFTRIKYSHEWKTWLKGIFVEVIRTRRDARIRRALGLVQENTNRLKKARFAR